MELDVRHAPDPVLSSACARPDPRDPAVVELADAMVALMAASPGCVGIAAPQVGHPVALFVLDVGGARRVSSYAGLVVLCAPVLLSAEGREVRREGCLSVPELTGDVPRATAVTVSGLVPGTGEERVVVANAFEARALQHELDHLQGLLFLDRVAGAHALFPRKRYL
ncbi:MAG: peptide deformylase [Actinobacteria bacterium]|nr:peptide deformylase [Actinomycetota bacterium]MCA1720948.1 peptide deformylase [Actinomycetota bacterium]